LPEVVFEGDEQLLKQMFLNLLDNAVKYTAQGGEVYVSMERVENSVRISVRDTGIGIPQADQPHIFDRFYRVDKARSRKLGGAGLGLSIARWIAEAHQGEIQVESSNGTGSIFSVTLPLQAMVQGSKFKGQG
jgi:signal transduction histidine kinase